VIAPNRKIVGEILHNYGRIHQLSIVVGIAYGSDLNLALGIMRDLGAANSRVLADPVPVIQIGAIADSTIQITVKPWVATADYGAAEGELYLALVPELQRRGIALPFPQREIRLLGNT
jgi:small conductance mechanosensitive channel